MFDAIAGRYDLLNRLLSGGRDRHWRKRAVAALHLTGNEVLLDLCTGTADLALAASQAIPRAQRIIGVDFSGKMLRIAREKVAAAGVERLNFVRGDASDLALATASIDAATIGFGIRNVEDSVRACCEIARVLRPGGRLVILEFSLPKTPIIRALYISYFKRLLPLIGRLVSRHPSAYTYLPASVEAFPSPEAFAEQLRVTGFSSVRVIPLTFGVVYMFIASKGGRPAI